MKKFLILSLILFAFLFGHIYQKVKIVVLAYQMYNKKIELDNLVEEKGDFVYNFYKEANLLAINERLAEQNLELNYPKEFVKVTSQDAFKEKPYDSSGESLLVKILSFSSQVEARP